MKEKVNITLSSFKKNSGVARALNEYLQNNNTYGAFFIKGGWGIGKTYFIKKYLIYFETKFKGRDFLYISLSGLTNSFEIDNALFEATFPKISAFENSGITKLGVKLLKTACSAMGFNMGGLNKVGESKLNGSSDSSSKSFPTLHDVLKSVKKGTIIIFDDFERCLMPIESLIGYISAFCEKKENKIIIIGNEKELISRLHEQSEFQNKLIASTLIANTFEQVDKSNFSKASSYDELCSSFYEELIKEMNIVKNRVSNPIYYDLIKEKIVYQEISIQFDPESIVSEVIKSQALTPDNRKKMIIKAIKDKHCQNVRSIVFSENKINEFVTCFNKVYKKESEDYDELLDYYICHIFPMALSFKENSSLEKSYIMNKENDENYAFLRNFIVHGSLSKEELLSSITLVSAKKEYNFQGLSLSNVFLLEDDEITKKMKRIIEDFYKGKIPFQAWPSFFILINEYSNSYGFEELTTKQKLVEKVKELLSKTKEQFDPDYLDFFSHSPLLVPIKDLKEMVMDHNKKIDNSIYTDSLFCATLSAEEKKKIKDNSLKNHSFLSNCKYDELEKLVLSGKNKNLKNFLDLLSLIYGFTNVKDYFTADKDTINQLIDFIAKNKENSSFGKMKRDIYKKFVCDF